MDSSISSMPPQLSVLTDPASTVPSPYSSHHKLDALYQSYGTSKRSLASSTSPSRAREQSAVGESNSMYSSSLIQTLHSPVVFEGEMYEVPSTKELFRDDDSRDMMEELTGLDKTGKSGTKMTLAQKTAHKEKNLYQMINMLSTRLGNLDNVVEERRTSAREDLNANSTQRSAHTKRLMDEGPSLHALGIHGFGSMTNLTLATQSRMATADTGRETTGIFGPVKLAYRHTAQTEAGRRLEGVFEEYEGGQGQLGRSTVGGGGKKGMGKDGRDAKARLHQKILESRKQERLKFEKKLQANMEDYLARSVSDVTYRIPTDGVPPDTISKCQADAAANGDQNNNTSNNINDSDNSSGGAQPWPIPLDNTQMNPKLILEYACERIVLPGNEKGFRRLAVSSWSCRLFVWSYWLMHCKFFQDNSTAEQVFLLKNLSQVYVQFLAAYHSSTVDQFFSMYPYLLASAMVWGFYYLCPGSRHLYNTAFKRILYLQTVMAITGHHVCPASVQIMRHRLFPDDVQEEEEEVEDVLPSLPKSKPKPKGHLASLFSSDSDDTANTIATQTTAPAAVATPAMPPPPLHITTQASVAAIASVPSGTTAVPAAADNTMSFVAEGGEHQHQQQIDAAGTSREVTTELSVPTTAEDVRQASASSALDNSHAGSHQLRPEDSEMLGTAAGSTVATESQSAQDRNAVADRNSAPLLALAGERKDLRFRPAVPSDLRQPAFRQHRTNFEASKTSPLLQGFLGTRQASTRRAENIRLTYPVRWCESGGVETYRRHQQMYATVEPFSKLYQQSVEEYKASHIETMKKLRKEKHRICMEKRDVLSQRGSIGFERFCLDLVNDITRRGLKRSSGGRDGIGLKGSIG